MDSIASAFIFLIGLFVVKIAITLVSSIYWVSHSPSDINTTDTSWSYVFTPIFPVRIVYYYLMGENQLQEVRSKTRVAGILVIAGVVALFTGGTISPPDIILSSLYVLLMYPLGIVVGYFLTMPSVNLSWGTEEEGDL